MLGESPRLMMDNLVNKSDIMVVDSLFSFSG